MNYWHINGTNLDDKVKNQKKNDKEKQIRIVILYKKPFTTLLLSSIRLLLVTRAPKKILV